MARNLDSPISPLAEEYDVGDDSDLPGFSQPVTADDIDAILNSGTATEAQKRELLGRTLDDLRTRRGMDEMDEVDDLIRQIQSALAALRSPADGTGTPGAYGWDSADRVLQPDEILERREEEDRERDLG
jgi:hypothetical protein